MIKLTKVNMFEQARLRISIFRFQNRYEKEDNCYKNFIWGHCIVVSISSMAKITYPRPCPHCRKLLNNRFSYRRHKAHCGKTKAKVQCLYCEKSFDRLDNCKRHMKDAHSEAAKRKAEDSAELARLELLRTNKVPRAPRRHKSMTPLRLPTWPIYFIGTLFYYPRNVLSFARSF